MFPVRPRMCGDPKAFWLQFSPLTYRPGNPASRPLSGAFLWLADNPHATRFLALRSANQLCGIPLASSCRPRKWWQCTCYGIHVLNLRQLGELLLICVPPQDSQVIMRSTMILSRPQICQNVDTCRISDTELTSLEQPSRNASPLHPGLSIQADQFAASNLRFAAFLKNTCRSAFPSAHHHVSTGWVASLVTSLGFAWFVIHDAGAKFSVAHPQTSTGVYADPAGHGPAEC